MIDLPKGSRVLVVAPNWLGDAVMAEPAIRALAKARPDLEVTVAAPAALADVYAGNPAFKRVLALDRKGAHGGLFGRFRVASAMREGGFAAAVLLRDSFGAAFEAWKAGIPARVGYASFGRGWMLSAALAPADRPREQHRTRSYMGLMAELGVAGEAGTPEVHVADATLAEARALVASEGGEYARPLVGIHPGAAYGPAKMWGAKKFAQLADRYIEDHGATVVLCGSKAEEDLAAQVVAEMRAAQARPGALRNLCGRTPGLALLAAVFKDCQLVVGNDSGPVHLAAAVGTPAVAVFGSTSPEYTGIKGPKAINVWERMDCAPCFKRDCPREDYMACMDAIPANRIYTEAAGLLGLAMKPLDEIPRAVGDTPSVPDRGD